MDLNELPEKPEGWTKHLLMHMNFGDEGGAASFEIKDPKGNAAPFGYQYDTRRGGITGFTLPGVDGAMTWAQLRAKWPEWRAAQAANAKGKQRAAHGTKRGVRNGGEE
ncbi:MAG: hypothetical protein JNM98_21765 [Rhodocyclaceae bacterium]|nr:hypothetical protein [Rhodocyclaceae bacterium]